MNIEEFEQLKKDSLGHLLIKSARLYNESAIESLKSNKNTQLIKASHLNLFPHIPFEGITVKELATKMGVSKQAISILVKELLEMKILIKKENPEDKRSFFILFNTNKNSKLFEGMKYLASLDSQLKDILSEQEFKHMKSALTKIIDFYK